MKRHFVLILILVYVCGIVGLPVAAYSCAETGEAGVVSYFSAPPGACYADSCCDAGHEPEDLSLRGDVGCCDLDVQVAAEHNRMLLPGQKDGQVDPLAETPARFGDSQPDTRIANTLPPVSIHHTSISLPLLF